MDEGEDGEGVSGRLRDGAACSLEKGVVEETRAESMIVCCLAYMLAVYARRHWVAAAGKVGDMQSAALVARAGPAFELPLVGYRMVGWECRRSWAVAADLASAANAVERGLNSSAAYGPGAARFEKRDGRFPAVGAKGREQIVAWLRCAWAARHSAFHALRVESRDGSASEGASWRAGDRVRACLDDRLPPRHPPRRHRRLLRRPCPRNPPVLYAHVHRHSIGSGR